jgi:hypothetical protein
VQSQAEDVAKPVVGSLPLVARVPATEFFGSEFSAHTNSVIGFIFGLVLF